MKALWFLPMIIICLSGCEDHYLPRTDLDWYHSESCDQIAIQPDGKILAVINTHHELHEPRSTDTSLPSPYWSTQIRKYGAADRIESTSSFDPHAQFSFGKIVGIRILNSDILLVGHGLGLLAVVKDSTWQSQRAIILDNDYAIEAFAATPVRNEIACLYGDWETVRMIRITENGDVAGGPFVMPYTSSPREFAMLGLSNGNILIRKQGRDIVEYDSTGQIIHQFASDSIYFRAFGETATGNLLLFGSQTVGSGTGDFVVAERIDDTLRTRSYRLERSIGEVQLAARSFYDHWLIACRAEDETNLVVWYNGSDSTAITDSWTTNGKVVPVCSASWTNGWTIFGGNIEYGREYDRAAYYRKLNPSGQGVWLEVYSED